MNDDLNHSESLNDEPAFDLEWSEPDADGFRETPVQPFRRGYMLHFKAVALVEKGRMFAAPVVVTDREALTNEPNLVADLWKHRTASTRKALRAAVDHHVHGMEMPDVGYHSNPIEMVHGLEQLDFTMRVRGI